MRTRFVKPVAAILLILFAVSACEKEKDTDTNALSIEALVERANKSYMGGEVFSERSGLLSASENQGLPDEYMADENFDKVALRNKLHSCLRSTRFDEGQRELLIAALREFAGRNQNIISRYRENYVEVMEEMKAKHGELMESFEDGQFNREQLQQHISALRERYLEVVKNLRAEYADGFSRSYALLLREIRNIFTDEQWEAFATCLIS